MRRSEINRAIANAKTFFAAHQFLLPRFAFLSPDELRARLNPQSQIYKGRLGWDVTDFGAGNFAKSGIVLFTIRNGDRELLSTGRGRLYCEKVLLFQKGQCCPSHSHFNKTEDLINRGGGTLTIRLTAADLSGRPRQDAARVLVDEEPVTFKARIAIQLEPGQSIVLEPGMFHALEAADAPVLVGEVSLVNDDLNDNIFTVPLPRFPKIIEDEPPLHLLCADYDRVLGLN